MQEERQELRDRFVIPSCAKTSTHNLHSKPTAEANIHNLFSNPTAHILYPRVQELKNL
jgi:hypothetical protein